MLLPLILCAQLVRLPWDQVAGSQVWTQALTQALNQSVLPDLDPLNMEDFVPSYPKLTRDQRVEAWANLVAIDAKYESDWDPHGIYHEPPPLSVDSIGLLQLSYEDEGPYRLPIHLSRQNKDLENPVINLRCAVAIMEQLVVQHGQFCGKDANGKWTGLSVYWSTLRETIKKKGQEVPRTSFQEIRAFMRSLSFDSQKTT